MHEDELAVVERFPKRSVWRIVGKRERNAYWNRYRVGKLGRVSKVSLRDQDNDGKVYVYLSGLGLRPGCWARCLPEELEPATLEEWEYQRCIERLS